VREARWHDQEEVRCKSRSPQYLISVAVFSEERSRNRQTTNQSVHCPAKTTKRGAVRGPHSILVRCTSCSSQHPCHCLHVLFLATSWSLAVNFSVCYQEREIIPEQRRPAQPVSVRTTNSSVQVCPRMTRGR
jgi:hypothetical protein